ncbi:MAG: endonuclease/exonuclease/phosphatase family protein, partial [Micrococcales bacterium]|nr:endonuclease/exonuclease/phosphatase family protein [Micrococcales bacterium]
VVGVARLLEPSSYLGAGLAAAAPSGVLTGALAVLAFAVLALSSRGVGRRGAALGLVLALAATGAHAWWLAPLYTGSAPRATGDGLVVMVQNLEYGSVADLERVVDSHDVDLLVLVDLNPAQQDAVLASGLPSRFAAGGAPDPRGGTLVLSRFALRDTTDLTADQRSQLVRVSGSPAGDLVLAAAHPAAPYSEGTRPWRSQLEQVAAGVSAAGRGADGAVLLLGDLNATPDHRPFRDLLASTGLRDAAELANLGWSPTFPANGLHTTRGLRLPPVVAIDHVLVGRALTVTAVERVDVVGTDHHGVVARVARAAG